MRSGLVVALFMLVGPAFGQTDSPNLTKGSVVPHWSRTGNNSKGLYAITADTATVHGGKSSVSISCDTCSTAKAPEDATEYDVPFGSIVQEIRADDFRGKRVVFSAYLKTADIQGDGAGLWIRVDGPAGMAEAFDNMSEPDRMVHGTTGWTRYQVVLDVPSDAEAISVGVALAGKGRLWIDDASLQQAPSNLATTGDQKKFADGLKKELAKMTPEQLAEAKKSSESDREWLKTQPSQLQNGGFEE